LASKVPSSTTDTFFPFSLHMLALEYYRSTTVLASGTLVANKFDNVIADYKYSVI
jgi:hypothetical protein